MMQKIRDFWANSHLKLQIRIWLLVYLDFMVFYIVRKPFLTGKTKLEESAGISTTGVGIIDTLMLLGYSIGMLVTGSLTDIFSCRILLMVGLSLVGVISAAIGGFGFLFDGTVLTYIYYILFLCLGLVCSLGRPSCSRTLSMWFNPDSFGKVIGGWSTSLQLGSFLGGILTAFLLAQKDIPWQMIFIIPATFVVVPIGFTFFFFLDSPEAKQKIDDEEAGRKPDAEITSVTAINEDSETSVIHTPKREFTFFEVLRTPGIIDFSVSNFFIKIVRFTLLGWLTYYLEKVHRMSKSDAGYIASFFEVGGVFGVLVLNFISDVAPKRRVFIILPSMILGALCIALLNIAHAKWNRFAILAVITASGFFSFGVDSMMSGAAVQEMVPKEMAGRSAGIVTGLSSLGSAIQGFLFSIIIPKYGWPCVFYILTGCFLLAMISLSFVLYRAFTYREQVSHHSHSHPHKH